MAKNNESLNNSLFQLLRSRGYNPTLLGTDGKEIPVPDEAEVFQFHFIKDDKDYGPVTISIDGLNKLVIYYNDAIASSPSEEGHSEDTSWFTLLNHLKRFSQGHQLSFELKNTDHLKYDMAKRNNMKKIAETKGKSPYGPGGLVRDPPEKEIGVKIGKGGMKQFKVKTPPKKDKVEEAAKWRQGYSASGHPAGYKHKSGEVGPIGGTFTNEPAGYDGDTKKVPVQKYRDKEDELSGRANTKLSTTGKPLLPRNAQKNLKGAIKQSAGKHGPVNPLPAGHDDNRQFIEGLGDDFADMAKGMKNKDGSPRFANVRQGKPPVKPAGKATAPRAAEKGATSPADWYDQASGGRRYTGDSKVPTGTMVEGQLAEGYYATGRKSSYSDAVPQVKIILQHSRQLEEGERRYRAIERIFVENAAGERFLLDTTKPGLARVYARHIAEGGTPYDEQGKHIHSLCEEYTKMAGFVRATRNGQFNESTQSLVNEGVNHYNNLRETLHKMAGRRGYNAYFESWTPTLTEDEDSTDLSEMFASTELDPRIESVMPILRKLNKNITEVDHSAELAEWADDVIDESLGLAEVSNDLLGRYKKKAGKEASGLDTFANAVAKKGEDPAYSRAADWATKRANKRFSGIVKATNKEFANDNKPKQVDENYPEDWVPEREDEAIRELSRLPQPIGINGGSYTYFVDVTKKPLKFTASDGSVINRATTLYDIAGWMDNSNAWLDFLNGDEDLAYLMDFNIVRPFKKRTTPWSDQEEHENNMSEGDGLESNNPQGIPEATGPTPTQVFPDTKQGAVASFTKEANKRFVQEMDLPNCKVWPDPQVHGVWAIDNYKTGVRVIVYLAGYKTPGGDIRGPYDDFEEGEIPEREMKRHRRNDQAQNDVEDEMMEDLGPEQKKVGQLGPQEKVGSKGAVGKLVGVSESDGEPRTAFGKKDWDAEAEARPNNPYAAYRASGGKLSRAQWEDDRANGWSQEDEPEELNEYHAKGTVNGKKFIIATDDAYDARQIHSQNPHLSPEEAQAIQDHTETDEFVDGHQGHQSQHGAHHVQSTSGGYHGDFSDSQDVTHRGLDEALAHIVKLSKG